MLVPHLITEVWNQCDRYTCRGITRWSGYRYREGSPYPPGLECGSHAAAQPRSRSDAGYSGAPDGNGATINRVVWNQTDQT